MAKRQGKKYAGMAWNRDGKREPSVANEKKVSNHINKEKKQKLLKLDVEIDQQKRYKTREQLIHNVIDKEKKKNQKTN